MQYFKSIVWLLASIPLSLSHGGGMKYTIDGVDHAGSWETVLNKETGSIQRMWTWDAIYKVDDSHLACRYPGNPYAISYHAPIKAGSVISINYTSVNGHEPYAFGHSFGPMMAFMAACPETGCENVNLTAPLWFKIWEAGLLSGTWTGGRWAINDVVHFANLDIPTPKTLKKGKYLLKHDMISIETGQMQIFPNCIQLDVSGEGTNIPQEKDLVAFPGAYDGYDGKSWEGPKHGSEWFWTEHADDTYYPMPGPSVWKG